VKKNGEEEKSKGGGLVGTGKRDGGGGMCRNLIGFERFVERERRY
jgi:hypothetical protein